MNDVIYRQAAIDALDTGLWGVEWDKALATAMLKDLPSAQPEIVRCKDCKWRNVYQFPPKYDERDYCDKHEKTVSADGFCSWVERREE